MKKLKIMKRNGVTRLVFVFEKFVVKIPNFSCQHDHFLIGCVANWSERKQWKHWRKVKSQRTEMLCPTIFCSWFGLIQIQRRVKILSDDSFLTPRQVDSFKDITTDIKPQNFGFYKGRLVCVDYGQKV